MLPTALSKSGPTSVRRGLLAIALFFVGPVLAQSDPRLTAGAVVTQLEAAQRDLAARAPNLPDSSLGGSLTLASQRLGEMAESIRKAVGKETGKRIDKIDDDDEGRVLRGQAAALLTQAWLSSSTGCTEGDSATMATALATSLSRLAAAKASSKGAAPAIQSVEAADRRPLFAIHSDAKDVSLVLTGVNLHDAQCDDPKITATDEADAPLAAQPTITNAMATRLELRLPPGLQAGSYLLHVVPQKKARFLGCQTQPEATAVLRIVPPVRYSIGYTVTGSCRVGQGKKSVEKAQAPVSGTLPDITSYGAAVSQQVELPACEDPTTYTISAAATYADGSKASIGPITQSAAAGITAGLPGGLSLSWDPQVRQLFARSSANTCKGFY